VIAAIASADAGERKFDSSPTLPTSPPASPAIALPTCAGVCRIAADVRVHELAADGEDALEIGRDRAEQLVALRFAGLLAELADDGRLDGMLAQQPARVDGRAFDPGVEEDDAADDFTLGRVRFA
jgi:hypothetical protein